MEDFFAYRLIIEVIQGVHLSPLGFAACQSKKCTNKARVHQPIKKYTNQRIAPTALLVQLRQLHPLKLSS